jgi:hypothetical protein
MSVVPALTLPAQGVGCLLELGDVRAECYKLEGGALFEITCRTIHSRFLFRPTRRFNEIVVGILARAKTRYGVEISAFCCKLQRQRGLAVSRNLAPRAIPCGFSSLALL